MSVKSERRKKQVAERIKRRDAQHRPGEESKYARKVAYCLAHNVAALDVPEPKPWRT